MSNLILTGDGRKRDGNCAFTLKRSDVPSLPVNHISGPKSGKKGENMSESWLERSIEAENLNRFLKKSPESYVEPFRPISFDEVTCIIQSCRRGRILWTDALAKTPANLIQVSFTCNSKGTTQCVIFCQHQDNNYIFIGIARLLPTDSFNRLKGQRLAYYRAVTESEAIALPVGVL